MKLLALDAATEACSAALYADGEVTERFEIAPREHARLLLPMAHELLGEAQWRPADLDVLAFGCGPGAFTGLRIAAGIVHGLALGAGLPVAPVSDLAALAAGAARGQGADHVLAVADARMGEVYWCPFECADDTPEPRPLGPERVAAPETIPLPDFDASWRPAGNGWAAHETTLAPLAARLGGSVVCAHPRAADIARLGAAMAETGRTVPVEDAIPTYVRDDVARKPR